MGQQRMLLEFGPCEDHLCGNCSFRGNGWCWIFNRSVRHSVRLGECKDAEQAYKDLVKNNEKSGGI